MLAMASATDVAGGPSLIRRIRFANDLQELWYIRSDLMTALAFTRGEQQAQQEIGTISKMFDQLLPEARSYKQMGERL